MTTDAVNPIQLTDLRLHYLERTIVRARPVTESEVLSVLTDDDLVGELVKRGKLFRNVDKRSVWPTLDRVLMECFVSNWEPVGSVSEGEG